jgi:hypothetical protein
MKMEMFMLLILMIGMMVKLLPIKEVIQQLEILWENLEQKLQKLPLKEIKTENLQLEKWI